MRNGDGFADFRRTASTKLMNRETVRQGEFVGNPEAIQRQSPFLRNAQFRADVGQFQNENELSGNPT